MLHLLATTVFAAPPSVELVLDAGTIRGTERLEIERDGRVSEFDFRDQVHTDGSPDEVNLRLISVSASAHFDRVASLWLVRTEAAEGAGVSGWVGVLEPDRARLAGFPIEGRPATVALSGDGRVIAWVDADEVHVAPLVAPPRPALVFERDVDPPLYDIEPVLFADLDLFDFPFAGPDLSLELFDLVDIEIPIEEDPPLDLEEPEPTRPGPGAQRLTPEPLVMPTPGSKGQVLAALSHRGAHLIVARGDTLAWWSEGSAEPRWSATLDGAITGLSFDGESAVLTLDDGRMLEASPAGAPALSAAR